MVNPTGSITVNGITDIELVKILEIKIHHEGKFAFNPQQLQLAPNRAPNAVTVYNNAIFQFNSEQGLEAVSEIIRYLLKKEERKDATTGQ
jgi:hypothetical protein